MDELLRHDLEKAGWYPGRKVDIAKYCEEMQNIQRPVPDSVRSFLEEFWELTVTRPFPLAPDRLNKVEIYSFVPAGDDDDDNRDYEETLVGSPLFYVGFHESYATSILMDPSGRLFEAGDGFVGRVGDNALDGLSAMLTPESTLLERYDNRDKE